MDSKELFQSMRDSTIELNHLMLRQEMLEAIDTSPSQRMANAGHNLLHDVRTLTDYRIDTDSIMTSVIQQHQQMYDQCSRLSAAVAALLGVAHSAALDARYIRAMSWRDTATVCGYSTRWCQLACNTSFELLDSYGIDNVLEGRGIAAI